MTFLPTRILLATDNSATSSHAMEVAADLAKISGSELHIVNVLWTEQRLYTEPGTAYGGAWEAYEKEAKEQLNREVKKIEEMGAHVTKSHLGAGRPNIAGKADVAIINLAEELDVGLIVVGSRGNSSLKRAVLGSVSESIVRHAHCPVMVVR